MNLIEVYDQAKQIQLQRSESKVQDLTSGASWSGYGQSDISRRHSAKQDTSRIGHGANERSNGDQAYFLNTETLRAKRSKKLTSSSSGVLEGSSERNFGCSSGRVDRQGCFLHVWLPRGILRNPILRGDQRRGSRRGRSVRSLD